MDPAYEWDLTTLFKDDKAWEASFPELDERAEKLMAYKGTLKDEETILTFFREETQMDLLLDDLFTYAFLRRSEDTTSDAGQQMYTKIYGKYVEISAKLAFSNPEILLLPEETLKAMTDDPAMADYRYTMIQILRMKPHTLNADEEKLLAGVGEIFAAPKQISENLMDADMVFEPALDAEGKEHEVSGASYILLQSSPDRVLRKNAFMSFYKGFRQHINTFSGTYSAAVNIAGTEAHIRHYKSARAASMAGEAVPENVYDNLIASVRGHMDQMYRYVSLRKRLLKIDDLHYYDLYAPLTKGVQKTYSYDEAKQMVLDTVSVFGDKYTDTVKRAFAERWMDVYPNKGKTGGAYSSGTYRSNPFILTNFSGTLDAVSTIAHEMGHSMHTYFSNHTQQPQNAQYTLFVAEVASTVNENLLVERLLANAADPKERLAYLNQYLEAFKGTVYRQTMFAEFEKEAHELSESGAGLSASTFNGIYKKLIEDYFGPELTLDDEVQYEWARIPHFYRPFYVYKYATSYSAAVALSEAIRTEGQPAVDRYLKFLSLGGSMDPIDELKIAGVDFTTPVPVDTALDKFGRVIDAAEEAADELGM
ncbi:MAG: oligoendopeptidase F [Lachnospiraceae bacterium]|nr:oligoendopeptidase F [Lachnospiraceae bacterium]